jgi:predicted small metal-binding protein
MKTLRCQDVGFEREKESRATSEDEILQQAAEYARNDHGIEVTPEIANHMRAQIRYEPASRSPSSG